MVSEHYPEIADKISATINIDENDGTRAFHEPNVEVGFSQSQQQIVIRFPTINLFGESENLRIVVSGDDARRLGDSLSMGYIEIEEDIGSLK